MQDTNWETAPLVRLRLLYKERLEEIDLISVIKNYEDLVIQNEYSTLVWSKSDKKEENQFKELVGYNVSIDGKQSFIYANKK